MFKVEADMTESVIRWMVSQHLQVRREFITPWGICDLVGLRFNPDHVCKRSALGQHRPLTSITRAALLLRIPDIETEKSTTLARLTRECASAMSPGVVEKEVLRLLEDGFVVRSGRGCLQKRNGWMPLQDRLMAVELKMSRVEEAMLQAESNLGFASESYVALPSPVARRIAEQKQRKETFEKRRLGLLAVSASHCRVLIPANQVLAENEALQMYCVEKFWGRLKHN